MTTTQISTGARVLIRDAEWLVRRVDRTDTDGQELHCIGLSEIVRNRERLFLTDLESRIEVLQPENTKLVGDKSAGYQHALLYLESQLRMSAPTDQKLYIGHKAAMDAVPFQLDPALQALGQTRQRILIADAVGLGKTLEAGILVSELIRRGRGKRILVVAIKSMLTQFQKEFWNRFTIPLVRLDSVGIQRIRNRIPTNHNPFNYYDRAIISIDTLKQENSEFSIHLERAHWDIIIIDEAHNVAERGSGAQRNKLAQRLADKSDTLIMLSATPHDGRPKSFASLMNMLNPTAIANPEKYTPEDIKGLYIRRFKKDIQHQVKQSFQKRELIKHHIRASHHEEAAFDCLTSLTFKCFTARQNGGLLFKTVLEKALFSSPSACAQTIENRIKNQDPGNEDAQADIAGLRALSERLQVIHPAHYSKYQKLLSVITDSNEGFGWTGKDTTDRLVIFTERLETQAFLAEHLNRDLKLKNGQIVILHGGMSDKEQQQIVEDFGKEEADVRLLICTDVASEGINLHYLCHRMIHFDIPWSLMVFQQRNGRIDRYGQDRPPQIVYLITQSTNEKIKGDMRILDILIEKDQKATDNIGDPSAFMNAYNEEAETKLTANAIESGKPAADFEQTLALVPSALDLLLGTSPVLSCEEAESKTAELLTVFPNDYAYMKAALQILQPELRFRMECDDAQHRLEVDIPQELLDRSDFLPPEVWPEQDRLIFSDNVRVLQDEMKYCRKTENAWPRIHYLWELHPVMGWLNDKMTARFGRHEAPVIQLRNSLPAGECIVLMSGLIPNRKGHPLVQEWFGVHFRNQAVVAVKPFTDVLAQTRLGSMPIPNTGADIQPERLTSLLAPAVAEGRKWMSDRRQAFENWVNPKLNAEMAELERLRGNQYVQLELQFTQSNRAEQKEKEKRQIDRIFDAYLGYVQDTLTTEKSAWLQIIAVLEGVS